MNLLRRNQSTDQGTFGELLIDDSHFCYTLERPETGDHPSIPAGTYECNWFESPHNGWCYLLKDVPGRSMIEIHKANTYDQLRGCIALGMSLGALDGKPAVLQSGIALDALHNELGDNFNLTII